MVSDSDARKAVRQLMERFDFTSSQLLGLAYVLTKRDAVEYAQLLKEAEAAIPAVLQPLADCDYLRNQVYAALDDANADWSKAVLSMLNRGPMEIIDGITGS